ncbi:hypothetical protein OAJ69_03835 [Pseudomonadota bacterium]|nr:hypothetical protein [Pseudomonadota bacterium]
MNEKYIQALILGSIIGLAIVIDDIINPKNLINNAPISIEIIDEDSKNSDQLIKILDSLSSDHKLKSHKVILLDTSDDKTMGSNELKKIFKIKIDGNENDEEVKKDIRIKVNTDDMSDIDIQSIFDEIQIQLSDEEYSEVKSKLENARSELENELAEAADQLGNVDIDIQVEVDKN